ncbi:YbaB/EbfC family nucleoid-associated protein [Amycolatopsis kentuckyensis]|uniref:YbaB/EbfC family nucleoid-associated protein n=1 Tax=Amycolatopsis kentuckyensis TaxID=218823 RepID=UPI001ABF7777|nr:YbaB/EbfC family nucleoid-associated protein [Amycolatopsis kentuckyensis]
MNYQGELYHLAREINAATAAVAQTTQDAERTPLEWRLPGELGSVTVSGAGELTAVTLDAAEMRQYSAAALSRTLLEGIRDAEAQAEHRRAETIAAAIGETGLA